MTDRLRTPLQLATICVCVLIAASAVAGTRLRTSADARTIVDYGPPHGVPGVNNRVKPVSVPGYSGRPLVCQRLNEQCVELTREGLVPIGAFLDTTKGAVQLETRRASGGFAGMVVYAGTFKLQQQQRASSVLTAKLAGPRNCATVTRRSSRPRTLATKRKKPVRRRLWTDGSGSFRATGRYGSATVRGTKWLTEDRCSGTFVQVVRGRVDVHDPRRGITVVIRAPHSYLIRRPR